MPNPEPYLSIVVPSRNDDHGGDLLKRMQIFATALLEQCRRHQIPAELIIVEWNPPADRPRLAEALRWPREPGPCVVRFIEVPAAIHRRYRNADGLPLYQMIAKNVGIRRARGRFVLATNIDILFSDELMQYIAGQHLRLETMYRIDRHDVMAEVPDAPVAEQLAWCESHMIRVNSVAGTFPTLPNGELALESNDVASRDGNLTLGAGWFARELVGSTPFRWIDNNAEIYIHGSDPKRVLAIDMEPGPGVKMAATTLDVLDDEGSKVFSMRLAGRRVVSIPVPDRGLGQSGPVRLRLRFSGAGSRLAVDPRPLNAQVRRCALYEAPAIPRLWNIAQRTWWMLQWRLRRILSPEPEYTDGWPDSLHLTACGDFTMLAREHWLDLRGYPEFDMFAMDIDSLFCWSAHYGGAKEMVLRNPMRTYHIEHATGSGWTPEGQEKLFERMAEKGVPWLHHTDVIRWAADMKRLQAPIIFNREDWGLGLEDLKETQLVD
ncbi:MAG: hypothetical protein ABSF22_14395 [Bryobacteraceae bacterium]